jgi:hypothetical protein
VIFEENSSGVMMHRCGRRYQLKPLPCPDCKAGLPKEAFAVSTDMRTFETGATRNQDETKLDGEGFYHPIVVERFAQYLHKHRKQADGKLRDSDNWQKGMPIAVYMKSAWRHFLSWWKAHRGYQTEEEIEDSICGLIFNAQGYLFERLKDKLPKTESTLTPVQVKTPKDDLALLTGLLQPTVGRLTRLTPEQRSNRELP